MATSLRAGVESEDWSEPRYAGSGQRRIRAELLWTLFAIALLVTFVFFVIDDYPLRGVLAVH
ncbi:MAG: hypothetical protein AABM40_08675 [Chloroflexota bacterium]